MRSIVTVSSLASIAAAFSLCNNNCGRAVIGTARASPDLSARQSLCSEFVTATSTVTPAYVLPIAFVLLIYRPKCHGSSTVTVTAPVIYNRSVHEKRASDGTSTPTPVLTADKPAYASACPDNVAYWSACQCFSGIVATTVTVTAATPTETVPGATCTQGAEFAIYAVELHTARWRNLVGANDFGPGWINFTLQFADVQPDVVGVSSTIGGLTSAADPDQPISIYGTTGPAGSALNRTLIDHRGYFVPALEGFYLVSLEQADNAIYAWVGDLAVRGWTPSNARASRFLDSDPSRLYSFLIDVRSWGVGVPIPFRFLWLNYGGPGTFNVQVTNPRGSSIYGPGTPSNPQVISSCSGPGAPISPWAPWAQEI
ncbi:hypothetical protein S40285_08195 [Stachybotrys chlorohalonatus IBT 40285]|uniref:GLEYA adhesin domain-containing protein n=1 Tax=Stachybotrys chlorohalonatus (strain IBT 40285) TaxID=1283841 RepID=A0A084QWU7_STAC4|nr:hypothetical protein S40285_08195 [Stachybotrys chlorohalonata IBT 40285]